MRQCRIFRLPARKDALACAMLRRFYGPSLAGLGLLFPVLGSPPSVDVLRQAKSGAPTVLRGMLHETRSSPLDLQLGGDLAGLPLGAVRYLTREDLQALPQVSYTVTDDANFGAPTQARGVDLEFLAREFAAVDEKALVVAICKDRYRAHYSQAYIQAHRPVLVLEVNGEPPTAWPKLRDGSASTMGPYLISHPHFIPSFKILGHEDEAQIPWGVVRLEFRNEQAVFGAIAPRG